jgi:hypothetical protein
MLLTAGMLAAALPAASVLEARAAPGPSTAVGVGAREFRLSLYRASVPRGVVRFNLTNFGEDRHDLAVLGRDGRLVARSREVAAGGRTTLRVRLAAGRYRLVCDLADHERRGMRTSIRVTR